MGLHDLELLWGEAPRLEEDMVRNADLADVVQWRRLEQQANCFVVEKMSEARMVAQLLGEDLHVVLGPSDMVAGLVVASLCQ
ncbi:hypothetical protein D3C76_1003840 [compost metagenome]